MEVIFKTINQEKFIQRWREYIKNNTAIFKYLPIYLDYILFDKKFLISNHLWINEVSRKSL